jgi:Holliday junction DNA helicase RuvA
LTGSIQSKQSPFVVVDVAGVGYAVAIPGRLQAALSIGERVTLHTSLIVRDDAFLLYGFETVEQLGLFDLLRSVTGIGPKSALAIVGTLSPAEISQAVTEENSKVFESVSGVGVKTAKLIVLTLAGKLKAVTGSSNGSDVDLVTALQGLGWAERVAVDASKQVNELHRSASIEEKLRHALAILSSR